MSALDPPLSYDEATKQGLIENAPPAAPPAVSPPAAPTPQVETPQAGPVTVRMADVTPERVRWIWPGRLPVGKLVVLDGDPGAGKSTMTLDLAGAITTGSPLPDGHRPDPADVVLLSAEDGPGDTIRPRLDAAGADPARVHLLEAIRETDPDDPDILRERPPSIPRDIGALEALVTRTNAAVVVIDVLSAFLAGKVDSHRDQDVRGALMPLAKMAERSGCCVIVIRHLTKGGGGKALYRGQGSIGIVGAARVGLIAATDPDDDTRRILAVSKSNLAAMPESIAYRLVSDEEHGCGRIRWEGVTKHLADDLVADRHDDPDDDRDDAAQVLAAILENGPVWSKDAVDEMASAGFTKDQARRARKRAGVVTEKHGKPGDDVQGWKWRLRAAPEDGTEDGEDGSTSDPATFATFVPPSQDQPEGCTDPEGSATPPEGSQGSALSDPAPLAPLALPSQDQPEGCTTEPVGQTTQPEDPDQLF